MSLTTSARPPSATRALVLLCLMALGLGGVHCAQEREPIDRTRPWSLAKNFFVGANYTDPETTRSSTSNNYVVDAPVDQSLMPVGTYDDVDRIRWEIQENLLLARKSYEYVTGSAGRRAQRPAHPNGVIVAAYRIESHFDIRRAYNPTTGEELNVVEENVTDRRWYARDHIRVDWSRNLVDNPDWIWVWYGSVFGEMSFSPVAWNESNPVAPGRQQLLRDGAGHGARRGHRRCVDAPNRAQPPGRLLRRHLQVAGQPRELHLFGEPLPTCLIANFFANRARCTPAPAGDHDPHELPPRGRPRLRAPGAHPAALRPRRRPPRRRATATTRLRHRRPQLSIATR
jgi:hypothetical protein